MIDDDQGDGERAQTLDVTAKARAIGRGLNADTLPCHGVPAHRFQGYSTCLNEVCNG